MACNLAAGRAAACKDNVGGIKAAYLCDATDFDETDCTFDADGKITGIAGTFDVYKYDLVRNNTFDEPITASRDNGTSFFNQTLTLNLGKMSPKSHKEFKALIHGRVKAFVVDNNNNVFVAGLEKGLDVTSGSFIRGNAMGDMAGYQLTLEGQEKNPADFVEEASDSNPETAITDLGTITISTTNIDDINA